MTHQDRLATRGGGAGHATNVVERSTLRRMFESLDDPCFRLFMLGQLVSVTGTWMQSVALAWTTLQLTGDGIAVGLVSTLQYLPMLLAGPSAGRILDRFSRRRLLLITQASMAALAVAQGTLSATGHLSIVAIYLFALLFGLVQPIDVPARRLFIFDLVGHARVENAVTLNAMVLTSGRLFGPALAGFMLASGGPTACFFANAASYVAILLALARLGPTASAVRAGSPAKGHVRDGLRYAKETPAVFSTLVIGAGVSLFLLNYPVVLPILAERSFSSGPAVVGTMYACLSAGAVIGTLISASRRKATARTVRVTAVLFALSAAALATLDALVALLAVLFVVGILEQLYSTATAGLLQTATASQYRARVIALYSTLYIGAQAATNVLAGAMCNAVGPRWALLFGGSATVTVVVLSVVHRRPDGTRFRSA